MREETLRKKEAMKGYKKTADDYRQCKHCGKRMDYHSTHVFCSGACEMIYFDKLTEEHEKSCGSKSCQHCGKGGNR